MKLSNERPSEACLYHWGPGLEAELEFVSLNSFLKVIDRCWKEGFQSVITSVPFGVERSRQQAIIVSELSRGDPTVSGEES